MTMNGRLRSRSFGRQSGRSPRQLKWATDSVNASITSGGTGLLSQLNGALAATQEEQSTLVRTIICLSVLPVTPTGSTNAQDFALGVGVTSRDAFAVGGASVANPATITEEPVQGWLYVCKYWIMQGAGVNFGSLLIEKDIRTSRRIGNGVPFVRAENSPGAGTPFSVRIFGYVRSLYMLA